MIPRSALNNDEPKKELDKIKEIEKNVDSEKLVCETNEYKCSFKHFRTIKTFGRDIYAGKITLKEADEYQSNLLNEIWNFRDKTRPQKDEKQKREKEIVLKNLYNFFEAREILLDGFDSKIFLIKSEGASFLNFDRSKLKTLTPKQMLQRIPISLAQVKAGNNPESLLNEMRQIIYSLYQSKQITKKVYNNITKSIQ